jgi:hypothetical protein
MAPVVEILHHFHASLRSQGLGRGVVGKMDFFELFVHQNCASRKTSRPCFDHRLRDRWIANDETQTRLFIPAP